jgi:branched-chain amino acid transport system ATP-binding protein
MIPLLTVTGLLVHYGELAAVKGIDLEVAAGEIVVLLGSNGAGKSSTLGALVGLTSSGGRIQFAGRSIGGAATNEIIAAGMALVPEGRRVFPGLTVAENLLLGGAAHRAKQVVEHTLEQQLSRFPILRERYRQKAGLLSGGEQQLLAIARALMSAPKLLLLDEPSLGLAPQIVEQVFDLITELRDAGLTVLLVEQNAAQALDIATRGYVLQTGRIVAAGSAAELAASPLVREAYLAA